jgi:hypothetical protein
MAVPSVKTRTAKGRTTGGGVIGKKTRGPLRFPAAALMLPTDWDGGAKRLPPTRVSYVGNRGASVGN